MEELRLSGGELYTLSYNQVGSLRFVFDVYGNLVREIEYDSYGRIIVDEGSINIVLGFAGGLYDKDTGLVRFGYRDYDGFSGKWTAKDPIGFEGGDVSLYGYVLGDPIGFIDPEGLSKKGFNNPYICSSLGLGKTNQSIDKCQKIVWEEWDKFRKNPLDSSDYKKLCPNVSSPSSCARACLATSIYNDVIEECKPGIEDLKKSSKNKKKELLKCNEY